jgi:ribosomal protein S8
MRRSCLFAARVYSVPWEHGRMGEGHTGSSAHMSQAKRREGHIDRDPGVADRPLRRALHAFAAEPAERKRLTQLPGVEKESDLPADPITRLFFQRKGEYALYQGSFENPTNADTDRVQIQRRQTKRINFSRQVHNATYDFCHRLREASEQRKRFVVVPATTETKGAAEILYRHGIVAGFRDFHNDRAFAIELKYFQNEGVLNGIEPVSSDATTEFEWSPKMIRRQMSSFGVTNKIRIFILRTWDGRIIDHIDASSEGVGGRGLLMAF